MENSPLNKYTCSRRRLVQRSEQYWLSLQITKFVIKFILRNIFFSQWHKLLGKRIPSSPNMSRTYDFPQTGWTLWVKSSSLSGHSRKQIALLTAALTKPRLNSSYPNSVFTHSRKRSAPVADTFSAFRGCPLTGASTVAYVADWIISFSLCIFKLKIYHHFFPRFLRFLFISLLGGWNG